MIKVSEYPNLKVCCTMAAVFQREYVYAYVYRQQLLGLRPPGSVGMVAVLLWSFQCGHAIAGQFMRSL